MRSSIALAARRSDGSDGPVLLMPRGDPVTEQQQQQVSRTVGLTAAGGMQQSLLPKQVSAPPTPAPGVPRCCPCLHCFRLALSRPARLPPSPST